MRIIHSLEAPRVSPFGVVGEQDMVLLITLCLLPVRPVDYSCEMAAGWWGSGVEQVAKPHGPGKKLEQLAYCYQNTFKDMFRNFNMKFKFGPIQNMS